MSKALIKARAAAASEFEHCTALSFSTCYRVIELCDDSLFVACKVLDMASKVNISPIELAKILGSLRDSATGRKP